MWTPSPQISRRQQSRQQSPFSDRRSVSIYGTPQHRKAAPAISFVEVAKKKVGRIVSKLFFWRKKVNSERYDAYSLSTNDQVGDFFYSVSSSAAASSRSISNLKHSTSYGSSSAASLQLGEVDISLGEIYKATGNFAPANIIGEGGFGTVYKGRLRNGSLVAIKRARKDYHDQSLSAEFKNEILTLSKIEHNNLVRLFGYLEHGDERIMVVEYVGNGTLREHLDGKQGVGFELGERLDIAVDVAHAIAYLHTYSDPPIIHRDIKSSNILITENFRAKVADFGFARLADGNSDATHISTQVKGTAGYLDPEYLKTYQLTEKSDVYSFGVLLVEMVTARHPIESNRRSSERMTIKWAMHRLKDGEAVIAMDPRLRRSPASTEAVEKVLKLARQCVAPSRQYRPSMRKCAEILWGVRKDFKEKSLPYSVSRNCLSADHITANANSEDLYGTSDSFISRFVSA